MNSHVNQSRQFITLRRMVVGLVSIGALYICLLSAPFSVQADTETINQVDTQQSVYTMLLQVRDLQEQIIATGNYHLLSQTRELLEQIRALQTQSVATEPSAARVSEEVDSDPESAQRVSDDTDGEEAEQPERTTERMVRDALAAWDAREFTTDVSPDLLCNSTTPSAQMRAFGPQAVSQRSYAHGVETLEIGSVQVTLENGRYVCENNQWTPKICRYDRFDNCIPVDEPPLDDRQVHQPCEAPDGAWYPETVRAQVQPLNLVSLNRVRVTCSSGQIVPIGDER